MNITQQLDQLAADDSLPLGPSLEKIFTQAMGTDRFDPSQHMEFFQTIQNHPIGEDMQMVLEELKDEGLITNPDIVSIIENLGLEGELRSLYTRAQEDSTPDEFAGEEFRDDMEEVEYLDEITKRKWQHRAGIIK